MPEQEDKMITMPAIDMVATGRNIAKMRQNAGLTVKDLQIKISVNTVNRLNESYEAVTVML